MTIIIVAPTIPDLPLIPEEAAGIANAIGDALLLQGAEATVRGIVNAVADALADAKTVAGFWFVSHGSAEGILLTGGVVLNPISLAGFLSATSAEWVVLNTCDSRQLVTDIQLRASVDVVATEADIADKDAYQFGRLLAARYAQLGSIAQAAGPIATGDRHRFYPRRESMENKREPLPANPDRLTDQELLKAIYTRLMGDSIRGVSGLIANVEEIAKAQAALMATQREERHLREQLEKRVNANRSDADAKFSSGITLIWGTIAAVALEGVVLIVLILMR